MHKPMKSKRQKSIECKILPLQDSINKENLHCVVCMEYANTKEIYQCKNSHLMCSNCHEKIIESDQSQCPTCRIKLSRDNPCRSRLAEAIISKLQVKCPNEKCGQKLYNGDLKKHQRESCLYRPAKCKYNLLGCEWHGVAKSRRKHEKNCVVPRLGAKALLKKVTDRAREREQQEKRKAQGNELDRTLINLLSKRCRNILVRNLNLFKCSLYPEGFEAATNLELFGSKIRLSLSKPKKEKAEDEKNAGEEKKFSGKRTQKEAGVGKENIVAVEEENGSLIQMKIECEPLKTVKKLRIEGFVLSGPRLFCKFRPVPFSFLVKEGQTEKKQVTMSFNKSQAEELASTEIPLNLRILIVDRQSGVDSSFTASSVSASYDIEQSSDYDSFYNHYEDDFVSEMGSDIY